MKNTLTTIFEALKPGFLWVDAKYEIRYINAKAAHMLNLRAGEPIPRGPLLRAFETLYKNMGRPSVNLPNATGDGSVVNIQLSRGLGQDDGVAFCTSSSDRSEEDAIAQNNLLQVIRTELSPSVRNLNRQIQAIGESGRNNEWYAPLSLDMMTIARTLGKLVDLSEMWASANLLSNERVSIWRLLGKAWLETKPYATRKQLNVRFSKFPDDAEVAVIYGSEQWLLRVFCECLNASFLAVPEGGTMDIEYHQNGARALLVFKNSGMFAGNRFNTTDMNDAVAIHFQNDDDAPLKAESLIGFKLCQHIVSLHGGFLKEEYDEGMRNVLLELPVGAPAHETGHSVDAAQAELYARDLAALMSRNRKKNTPPA